MTPDPAAFRHLMALAGPAAPELCRRFGADLRRLSADLDQAHAAGDAAAQRRALHGLVALAGTAGCPDTQDLATRLHAALREGDETAAQALRPALARRLADLIAMIAAQRP